MAQSTWNYVGDGLEATGLILAAAALSALGTAVKVAPFDGEVSDKVGVWLRGEAREMDVVRTALEAELDKRGVAYSGLEWQEPFESGAK